MLAVFIAIALALPTDNVSAGLSTVLNIKTEGAVVPLVGRSLTEEEFKRIAADKPVPWPRESMALSQAPTVMSSARYAFVTLVDKDNKDYIDSAAVLARSLKRHSWDGQADLICLLSEDKQYSAQSLTTLEANGFMLMRLGKIPHPFPDKCGSFCDTYEKLHLWQLDSYEKILYIDADAMVRGNVNELFNMNIGEGIAAAPHCPPATQLDTINSGVFLAKPSQATFEDMIRNLGKVEARLVLKGETWEYGDQHFIHGYYRQCFLQENCEGRITLFENKYNSLMHLENCVRDAPSASIVHFSGHTKPWKNEYPIAVAPLANEWQEYRNTV